MTRSRSTGQRTFRTALALGALGLLSPGSADAHFILREPASWMSQDLLGSPQKLGPCGSEPGGTPTGTITAVQAGSTITVTITETIFHPGHYRIALATNDRSDLPAEPVVTPGTTPCGSVVIQDPPVFPVLADGVFLHTRPLSGPQTLEITLPPNVTCTHCTLQILEFMSNHGLNNPGGCFYHHCSDLSISSVTVDAGSPTPDAGSPTPDAGSPSPDAGAPLDVGVAADVGAPPLGVSSSNGCACGVAGSAPSGVSGLGGLVALAAFLRRRRRR